MTPIEEKIATQLNTDIAEAIRKANKIPVAHIIGILEGAKFYLLSGGNV